MASTYTYRATLTAVAGTVSGFTANVVSGAILKQIYIKSASSDTQFDAIIKDHLDVPIRRFLEYINVVNDLTECPAVGIHTVLIENSTADEEFTILLKFQENPH